MVAFVRIPVRICGAGVAANGGSCDSCEVGENLLPQPRPGCTCGIFRVDRAFSIPIELFRAIWLHFGAIGYILVAFEVVEKNRIAGCQRCDATGTRRKAR